MEHRIFLATLFLSFQLVFSANSQEYFAQHISYTSSQMKEHKARSIARMHANLKIGNYQLSRAIKTVMGDDTDYIPKVPGAGEIFFDGTFHYQLMHNGIKIHLNSYYDEQWLTDVIYGLKGHHEPQEEKCFYEILKYVPANATMIELGSYWAYYSLWFALQIPGARNYMIEPDLKRLNTGKHNFQLNNKTGNFYRGYTGPKLDKDPDFQGAEQISIDDFIEREKIEHVHILHSDIQGSEAAMLETTVKHLDKIDYFIISTHHIPTHHIPCVEFFKKHGFTIVAVHTSDQSCSGDGLVVAKRKGAPGPDSIPIRHY